MGFLKKSNAPSELPDLAIDGVPSHNASNDDPVSPAPVAAQPIVSEPTPIAATPEPAPVQPVQPVKVEPIQDKPIESEPPVKAHHEDVMKPVHDTIKEVVDEGLFDDSSKRDGFFDEVLEDINGGIADTEKLEEWYKNKFVDEDVVSNMKGYWEGNKSDIIIKSFGAEYKREINDKIKVLRELEEDWREIYFRLVKKEEEMKKEERELKETVSEFVSLCKRRKTDGEKREKEEK